MKCLVNTVSESSYQSRSIKVETNRRMPTLQFKNGTIYRNDEFEGQVQTDGFSGLASTLSEVDGIQEFYLDGYRADFFVATLFDFEPIVTAILDAISDWFGEPVERLAPAPPHPGSFKDVVIHNCLPTGDPYR